MALILECRGLSPAFDESVWMAENATIVGDVKIGVNCSIWFGAVIRGDVNSIIIGDRVNVQDGAVIHCTYEKTKTIIGDDVSIGHNAIVHGCKIANKVLIGMGAIVMDNVQIGENVIIAAGSVVTQNTVVESNSIYAGVPAKKIKSLEINNAKEIERIAGNYLIYAKWFNH
jgi:carbonic anhydrase/acetyltransferase-like protein (isoleucine patch superfamily)